MKKEIMYQATVSSEGGGGSENYVGLTLIKKGFWSHFNHEESKGTTLSAHIWKLTRENKKFDISWKIFQAIHTRKQTRMRRKKS